VAILKGGSPLSKIEWCDETLNPLGWGCYGPGGTPEVPRVCSYCYAKRMAHRGVRDCELCRQFIPHWHPEMLDKPHHWKKPRRIFVQSMGDLFHPETPQFRIELVLAMAKVLSRHTFQFLTKNPKRLKEFNPWPANCWVGTTVTNQDDAIVRVPPLWNVEAPVRFVSFEPLLGPINVGLSGAYIKWAIIGGQTGPGAVKPKPEWVQGLIDQYRAAGVALFLKDNLKWGEKIQEFPR
jgi:protein gp37